MDDLVERVARAMMKVSDEFPMPDAGSCQVCAANNVRTQARAAIAECFKWRPIDADTPTEKLHLRGMFINDGGTKRWEDCLGRVGDNGDFEDQYGNDLGWKANDFTHWLPLPEPPKETEKERQR